MNLPRVVIAGTGSGCGKTTISMGLMAALSSDGKIVQPFKVGPDYIDPMYHTQITGRYSINLDSWMLNGNNVKELFVKHSEDARISIIEGVMGLYDGLGGNTQIGSTAEIAQILGSPVVLVVNGAGMSLSIAAMIKGYIDFNKKVQVKGVIINKIKSISHYRLLKEIIENELGIEVFGYLLHDEDIFVPSRHLGLVPENELELLNNKIYKLSCMISDNIEIDRIMDLSEKAAEIERPLKKDIKRLKSKVKIGVAYDKAFNFYYRDNIELLEDMGACIRYFSPVRDAELPDDLDGLYFGGGYPEVFARELEANSTIKRNIKNCFEKGMPIYAECGGLIYMCDELKDFNGDIFNMCGLINARIFMTSRLQRFGYVEAVLQKDCILGKKGTKFRAHEFHYSEIEVQEKESCMALSLSKNGKVWECGFSKGNLIAGYPHIHFYSNTDLAYNFLKRCLTYAKEK